MKSNKAFTLIELLAVISILGLLVLITVPIVNNLREKAKANILSAQKEYVLEAAKGYFEEDPDNIKPVETWEVAIVTLKTLIDKGYIDEVLNPVTGEACDCENSYVEIGKGEVRTHIYSIYLLCGEYEYAGDENTFIIQEYKLKYGTIAYYLDNPGLLPALGQQSEVSYSTLKAGGYVEVMYDYISEEEIDVQTTGIVTNQAGVYTYYGNVISENYTSTIGDDIDSPVIVLTGSSTVSVYKNETYSDAGATATDDIDGDITGNIVTVNPVDTAVSGTYTITYNVEDSSSNIATEVTRTVVVELYGENLNRNRLSVGAYHSTLLKEDGTVWVCGDSEFYQIGNGSTTDRTTPYQTSTITNIIDVDAGYYHNVALKSDGTVWTWGRNNDGQIGNGTLTNRSTPYEVTGMTNVVKVSAGIYHTMALKADGTVWAWGKNDNGEIGDGTITERTTPIQVSGLTNIVKIYAAAYHNFALAEDGTLYGWGKNLTGQLGDGTLTNRTTPINMNILDIVEMSGGHGHTLLVKSDGTVWATGDNAVGQLGDGTLVRKTALIQIVGLTDIRQVSGGGYSSMAVKNDGTVYVWGDNAYGQLADGTTTDSSTPKVVSGMTDVLQVATMWVHDLVLKEDGTVWGWGYNGHGELGLGATGNKTSPFQMINGFLLTD